MVRSSTTSRGVESVLNKVNMVMYFFNLRKVYEPQSRRFVDTKTLERLYLYALKTRVSTFISV